MAYKAYLNNTELFFDSSIQDDSILLTRAIVKVSAKGAGSFDFTMPKCHRRYGQIRKLVDYIDVYRDDEPIFCGRVYSITDQFDGQQVISCEGLLAMLADSVYIPETYQGTLRGLVKRILDVHNTQMDWSKEILPGVITVEDSDVYREYINYETSISRLNDLVASYGGYLMIRKNYDPSLHSIVDVGIVDIGIVDTGNQRIYLDWLDDFTRACTQEIELSWNLLDIKREQDSNGIATVILPLGAKNDDGSRVNISSVNAGSMTITADAAAIDQYGFIVKAVIWDDVHEPARLKTKAQTYLQAALTPRTRITLSAVDLADAGYQVDSFRVGQKITVTSKPHGLDAVQFACVEQQINLLQPSQNKLELGDIRLGYIESTQRSNTEEKILVSVSADIEHSQEVIKTFVDLQTALITGNRGGCAVLHDADADGMPDEMLFMDTNDIQTAVCVLRINKNGIGFSTSGYSGTYNNAWTIDGHFNADFITAGTMLADRIRGGTLQLGGYDNQSGLMQVLDEVGNVVIKADKDGLESNVLKATDYIYVDGNNQSKIKIPLSFNDREYFFQISTEGFLLNSSIGKIYTAIRGYVPSGDPEPPRETYGLTAWSKPDSNGYIWSADYQPGILRVLKGTGTYASYLLPVAGTTIYPAYLRLSGDGCQFMVDPENKKFYYKAKNAGSLEYISSTNTWQMNNTNLVVGSSKSRVVDTKDYNKRLLYCYEMASPMFGDVGEGTIGDDGLCYVMLDPILTETIVTDQYQVFLQPYGDGRCWVRERNSWKFIVEGTPGLSFGWELKAKQSDFDQLRLASPEERIIPTGVEAEIFTPGQPDYGDLFAEHMLRINIGREEILT